MSDLVDFLRARLDEDQRRAENASGRAIKQAVYASLLCKADDVLFVGTGGFNPQRILAEIDAKRLFIALYAPPDPHNPGESCPDCEMLRVLASIHADHPDYREEWRP